MAADIICTYPVGVVVCGEVGWKHNRVPAGGGTTSGAADGHPYTPGWKCLGESKGQKLPCPACANSPVRGYVRAE